MGSSGGGGSGSGDGGDPTIGSLSVLLQSVCDRRERTIATVRERLRLGAVVGVDGSEWGAEGLLLAVVRKLRGPAARTVEVNWLDDVEGSNGIYKFDARGWNR